MSYTGIINFDLLTLIQILAWSEEPTGVEFFDEHGIFLGRIYISQGFLRGAVFKEHKGELAFIQLVNSLNNTGGTFHKVPYSEPSFDMAVPPGCRVDALLLCAVANKETEEKNVPVQEQTGEQTADSTSTIEQASSYSRLTSTQVSELTQAASKALIMQEYSNLILPLELFPKHSREILDVFSLFNLQSLLFFREMSGYLIVFTEKYWQALFPAVDINTLDEQGLQAHTCITMAEIVRRYIQRKRPGFDTTYLTSEELLKQVDMAISEATLDETEVKIMPISPEESYDEELSIQGFTDTTLTKPGDRMEKIYQWLEDKLEEETSPLQYFFYPDKRAKFIQNKTCDPFRIVVAAMPALCQKICVNLRHYLQNCNREIVLYTVESMEDFQKIERTDWEDCHLAILEHLFIRKDVYSSLSRIPEKMAMVIVAKSRDFYRSYLGAPIFCGRTQGVYSFNDNDLARLIVRAWDIASS